MCARLSTQSPIYTLCHYHKKKIKKKPTHTQVIFKKILIISNFHFCHLKKKRTQLFMINFFNETNWYFTSPENSFMFFISYTIIVEMKIWILNLLNECSTYLVSKSIINSILYFFFLNVVKFGIYNVHAIIMIFYHSINTSINSFFM